CREHDRGQPTLRRLQPPFHQPGTDATEGDEAECHPRETPQQTPGWREHTRAGKLDQDVPGRAANGRSPADEPSSPRPLVLDQAGSLSDGGGRSLDTIVEIGPQ